MQTCLKRCSRLKKINRLCPNYWNTFRSQLDFFTLGCSGLCNWSPRKVQCGEGYRGIHQKGDGQKVGSPHVWIPCWSWILDIWIQIQPNLALHCGTQFWFLCDPRDQVCLFSTILWIWSSGTSSTFTLGKWQCSFSRVAEWSKQVLRWAVDSLTCCDTMLKYLKCPQFVLIKFRETEIIDIQ